jgi:alanine dehydrogenase
MIVGVPTEIKHNEHRVGIVPATVAALVKNGHRVLVQEGAGRESGISEDEFREAGAMIVPTADQVWGEADLVAKVKEPLGPELERMRIGQILFTYLHLAPNPALAQALLEREVAAIAFETVTASNGSLPLLAPMSEVAGRMSVQVGASLLQKEHGGRGVLLGGVPGVAPGEVLIVGGGVVGANAAKIAVGMGARVTVMDVSKPRLQWLDDTFGSRITTLSYSEHAVAEEVRKADLLVGAVLVPGARAPRTVTDEMVRSMKTGSVIVDVAIDQGGSIETIDRVTTHDDPTYLRHGVVHYSVANMPGAVPRTSTFALAAVTTPYLLALADKGLDAALIADPDLRAGLNTRSGAVTHRAVAAALGLPCEDPSSRN